LSSKSSQVIDQTNGGSRPKAVEGDVFPLNILRRAVVCINTVSGLY
ncbi:hypothetical protein LCGC14_1409790, partial [marine sediment metagenome]